MFTLELGRETCYDRRSYPQAVDIPQQIVDKYFADLGMIFSFKDDEVYVMTEKRAEDFMMQYNTRFIAKAKKQ